MVRLRLNQKERSGALGPKLYWNGGPSSKNKLEIGRVIMVTWFGKILKKHDLGSSLMDLPLTR